jgi:hypothetical protein
MNLEGTLRAKARSEPAARSIVLAPLPASVRSALVSPKRFAAPRSTAARRERPVLVLVSARVRPDDLRGTPCAGYYRLEWPPAGVQPEGPIIDLEAPDGTDPVDLFIRNLATGAIELILSGGRLGERFAALVGSASAMSLELLVGPSASCPGTWITLIQQLG